MDRRRFGNKGTYHCEACGKLTRETGNGESNFSLCSKCYQIEELENSLADGQIEQGEFDAKINRLKEME